MTGDEAVPDAANIYFKRRMMVYFKFLHDK
jgi:hypothetical protein